MDELLSNALDSQATNIDINITRDSEEIRIKISDNGKGMDADTLEKAKKKLNQPYRKDFEEYYGQLAGRQISQGGLNLIGMQVNEAEIKSEKGKGTTITVKRKR